MKVRYQGGGFDPTTGDGMMEARIRAAVDAEEVAKLTKRVNRKVEELAMAGMVGGLIGLFVHYLRFGPKDRDDAPQEGARP